MPFENQTSQTMIVTYGYHKDEILSKHIGIFLSAKYYGHPQIFFSDLSYCKHPFLEILKLNMLWKPKLILDLHDFVSEENYHPTIQLSLPKPFDYLNQELIRLGLNTVVDPEKRYFRISKVAFLPFKVSNNYTPSQTLPLADLEIFCDLNGHNQVECYDVTDKLIKYLFERLI